MEETLRIAVFLKVGVLNMPQYCLPDGSGWSGLPQIPRSKYRLFLFAGISLLRGTPIAAYV
jgi:hypothetical protein